MKMEECKCGNNIEENKNHIGNVYVTHTNYSGTENVHLYSCPNCQRTYEQTHYFDPLDDSDFVGKLKEFDISDEDLAMLIQKRNLSLPMSSKLNDGESVDKILDELKGESTCLK